MTRRRPDSEEPYTFAGEEDVHLDVARPEENGLALGPLVKQLQDELKDSVAAHQATCGCHPIAEPMPAEGTFVNGPTNLPGTLWCGTCGVLVVADLKERHRAVCRIPYPLPESP